MDTITTDMLERLARQINARLGAPLEPFEGQPRAPAVRHHCIERANGRFSFARIMSQTGGTHTLFSAATKRGLLDLMEAYLRGIYAAEEIKKERAQP